MEQLFNKPNLEPNDLIKLLLSACLHCNRIFDVQRFL